MISADKAEFLIELYLTFRIVIEIWLMQSNGKMWKCVNFQVSIVPTLDADFRWDTYNHKSHTEWVPIFSLLFVQMSIVCVNLILVIYVEHKLSIDW